MIRYFKYLWQALFGTPAVQDEQRLQCAKVEELPDSVQSNTLYLIGENTPWAVALQCPCGCAQVIQLSLLPDDSPSWKLSFDRNGRPTLHPSVWRTKGCQAHFFVRGGAIVWFRGDMLAGNGLAR